MLPLLRSFVLATLCAATPLLAGQSSAQPAADPTSWPNYRGPDHNGISKEAAIQTSWPADGPKVLWKAKVGEGYSGITVVNKKAYTLGNEGDKDTVFCFDAEKGTVLWSKTYDCPKAGGGYGGPRATPAIDNGIVYTFSNNGILNAWKADTGDAVYTKTLAKDLGAKAPQWGFSSSAIADGNTLFVNIATGGVALNKADGSILWKSAAGVSGYASPVLFTHQNKKCVAFFAGKELVAVDAATGNKLFSHPWDTKYDVNAADPIVSGTEMFLSSNYGRGGTVINFASGQAVKVWENKTMKNHFNACVLIGGALFGNSEGTLTCLDWKTGETKWTGKDKIDRGGITAVGTTLIVLAADGNLMLVDAKADKYNLIAKAQVIGGDCWTTPTLSSGRIFCRSHQGDVAVVDVKK